VFFPAHLEPRPDQTQTSNARAWAFLAGPLWCSLYAERMIIMAHLNHTMNARGRLEADATVALQLETSPPPCASLDPIDTTLQHLSARAIPPPRPAWNSLITALAPARWPEISFGLTKNPKVSLLIGLFHSRCPGLVLAPPGGWVTAASV